MLPGGLQNCPRLESEPCPFIVGLLPLYCPVIKMLSCPVSNPRSIPSRGDEACYTVQREKVDPAPVSQSPRTLRTMLLCAEPHPRIGGLLEVVTLDSTWRMAWQGRTESWQR